jgi:hypothetical protein
VSSIKHIPVAFGQAFDHWLGRDSATEVKIIFDQQNALSPLGTSLAQDMEVAFETSTRSNAGELAGGRWTHCAIEADSGGKFTQLADLKRHLPSAVRSVDEIDNVSLVEWLRHLRLRNGWLAHPLRHRLLATPQS